MAMWNAGAEPFAAGRPPILARHVGRCPGLVDEHEFFRIEVELAVEPRLAPRQDVRAILLASHGRSFLSR